MLTGTVVDTVLFDPNASYYFRWKLIIFDDFPIRSPPQRRKTRAARSVE